MTTDVTVCTEPAPEDENRRNEDFYKNLRKRIRGYCQSKMGRQNKWIEFLLFAPDLFHVLVRLTVDSRVPAAEKAKLVAAIAYFVSPLDLMPEGLLGPAGYADDVVIAALVLNGIINRTSPEVVRQNWAGDDDVLVVIQNILKVADNMIGSGLWRRVKGMFT